MAPRPWVSKYIVKEYVSKEDLEKGLSDSLLEGASMEAFARGGYYDTRWEVVSIMASSHYQGKFTVVYAEKIIPRE